MSQEHFLKDKADRIRDDLISVAVANGAGHIAPSLSCVDILVALYYEVMNYQAADPFWPGRDRLIFSKAHGCYGLYAILADKGLIGPDLWRSFYDQSGPLAGCAERNVKLGLEAGCGSLGHGLPMAVGLALGAKLQRQGYHVFCVVGDGELQEGSNWEAIQFAVKHELDNLTIIVDANRLQAMDFVVNILDKKEDDLVDRLVGFGLKPLVCPGHEPMELAQTIRQLQASGEPRPHTVIAKTIKGFGLKCMENVAQFHFRLPTEPQLQLEKTHG